MYKNDNDEIEGSYMRKKIIFKTADIVYITHYQKGSVLHLCREKEKPYTEGNIIVPYNFKQLLELLDAAEFSVPHNSYIVNLRYVSSFNPKTDSFVADGRELPMSKRRKGNFLNDLVRYMSRNREYEKFQTPEEQIKERLLKFKYYVWLIRFYLEQGQYEKIKDVLSKLQVALRMEETS